MQKKVLVIGSGGREHALCWRLSISKSVGKLFCMPGNPGTSTIAQNIPLKAGMGKEGFLEIKKAVLNNQIDLVVVGPEEPLANGLSDFLRENKILVFGPSKEGAKLESSKFYAKSLMDDLGIKTAKFETFSSLDKAENFFCDKKDLTKYVIKADALAAGKGVYLPNSREELKEALSLAFSFGKKVLVEERLSGTEISVFGFVSKEGVSNLIAATDYKRLKDKDLGPNTGGMGCYTPPAVWNTELKERVYRTIFVPIAKELNRRNITYGGVLYAGLIVDKDGTPSVLEFNCRFGDPECQILMPTIECDFGEVVMAVSQGKLPTTFTQKPVFSVGVVAVSGGYPKSYKTGFVVGGLSAKKTGEEETTKKENSFVFHSGTKFSEQGTVTGGGRVLTVVGVSGDLKKAKDIAYSRIKKINFSGIYFRKDIAKLEKEV